MKKKKLISIEYEVWKTDNAKYCNKPCWCRRIVTVPKKGKRKRIFVPAGQLAKKQAELIVRVHNEWLEIL